MPEPAQPVEHPGHLLTGFMRDKNFSQVRLARELGVSVKHVWEIRRGKSLWSTQLAVRMEAVMGIPATELMQLKDAYVIDRQRREQPQ